MNIYEAQVISNHDELQEGKITVRCNEISGDLIQIYYTSPYFNNLGGGIIALPEEGSQILIIQPSKSNTWYYLSTIVSANKRDDDTNYYTTDGLMPDKQIYRSRNKPQRLVIQDCKGNKLAFSNVYSPNFINSKVELKSSTGKVLSLCDSPEVNAAILRNEHGDGITVTSESTDVHSAQSIEVKSRGSQTYVAREASMTLIVTDGREVNIRNESTGAFKNPGDPKKYGNVNISSKFRDVNIYTDGEEGSLFIDSRGSGGLIQLDSNGKIIIHSIGDISVHSEGNLNIKSEGNLNLEGSEIGIKSSGNVAIQAGGDATLQGGGTAALDGSQVHFNSGRSRSANGASILEPELNNYEF